jgi:site-specific recombinase XerD
MESRKAIGVSKSTLDFYKDRLGQAFRYINNPYGATYTDIQTYLNTIPPNDRGLSTRHCAYRAMKTFYKWLDNVYDFPNPMRKMQAPKLNKNIMPTLKLEEIKGIMKTQSTRNKAIIALALAFGLRMSELARVNIEDIDWQEERIWTKGKGAKESYAPLQKFSQPY